MQRNVKFASFTISQFEEGLKKALRAVVDNHKYQNVHLQKDKEATHEHSYKIFVGLAQVHIYINSSIALQNTVCDGKGDDAIRVNLIDGLSGMAVLPKQSHVKRLETWQKNLESRIDNLFLQAYTLEFCPCGSPKRDFTKRDKSGTFFACCGWNKDHHKKHFGKI
jgi:hypothetical protein